MKIALSRVFLALGCIVLFANLQAVAQYATPNGPAVSTAAPQGGPSAPPNAVANGDPQPADAWDRGLPPTQPTAR